MKLKKKVKLKAFLDQTVQRLVFSKKDNFMSKLYKSAKKQIFEDISECSS